MDFLFRRVHISWLIAVACTGFLVGVWLALYVFTAWWVIIPAGAIGLLCLVLRLGISISILIASMVFVGLSYGSQVRGGVSVYQEFYSMHVTVEGRVREDPTFKNGSLSLQLESIKLGGRGIAGSVWASTRTKADIKRGDIVTIMGELGEGFGNFPASLPSSVVENVERPVPGDVGRVVRDWFADAIRTVIPEPQASLGIGYLTGQKSALPDDLAEALKIAGLTHVVVASGYNLTILVRLSRRLFARVSAFASTAISGMLVAAFMAMTGMSPSMARAGLVSGLSLATWYYGRTIHPFVLLPFAAAVTVALNPSYLWGDIGWQLSFAAFAGVMIVAPLLQQYFFGDKKPGIIRQVLSETVAAHVVTVPIVAQTFGVISNVAIPANLLIVPLVPLAMLLTFIAGIAALAMPFVAGIVALPATWLLTYTTSMATYFADLPWSQLALEIGWWVSLVYYVLLGVGCWWMWRSTRFDLSTVNVVD